MKICWPATLAAAALALSGCGQSAGNGQSDTAQQQVQPQQQIARDWYNEHHDNLPEGLRHEDRLTAEQEARLREGAVIDNDMRDRIRPAPRDLSDRLPPPPRDHRYVAVGGHIGLIDNNFQVKALIHLHDR